MRSADVQVRSDLHRPTPSAARRRLSGARAFMGCSLRRMRYSRGAALHGGGARGGVPRRTGALEWRQLHLLQRSGRHVGVVERRLLERGPLSVAVLQRGVGFWVRLQLRRVRSDYARGQLPLLQDVAVMKLRGGGVGTSVAARRPGTGRRCAETRHSAFAPRSQWLAEEQHHHQLLATYP